MRAAQKTTATSGQDDVTNDESPEVNSARKSPQAGQEPEGESWTQVGQNLRLKCYCLSLGGGCQSSLLEQTSMQQVGNCHPRLLTYLPTACGLIESAHCGSPRTGKVQRPIHPSPPKPDRLQFVRVIGGSMQTTAPRFLFVNRCVSLTYR
jgi:hypothetical protein